MSEGREGERRGGRVEQGERAKVSFGARRKKEKSRIELSRILKLARPNVAVGASRAAPLSRTSAISDRKGRERGLEAVRRRSTRGKNSRRDHEDRRREFIDERIAAPPADDCWKRAWLLASGRRPGFLSLSAPFETREEQSSDRSRVQFGWKRAAWSSLPQGEEEERRRGAIEPPPPPPLRKAAMEFFPVCSCFDALLERSR